MTPSASPDDPSTPTEEDDRDAEATPTSEVDPTSTQPDDSTGGGGIVLDIAEQRIKTESDEPSARGWLRAGAGTLGVSSKLADVRRQVGNDRPLDLGELVPQLLEAASRLRLELPDPGVAAVPPRALESQQSGRDVRVGQRLARLVDRHRRAVLRGQRGQGTVEYVGLILLVAVLMAGMVVAVKGFSNAPGKELAEAITKKIVQAVRHVTFK